MAMTTAVHEIALYLQWRQNILLDLKSSHATAAHDP